MTLLPTAADDGGECDGEGESGGRATDAMATEVHIEQALQGLSDACLLVTGADRVVFANDAAKLLLRPKGRILGRKLDSVLGDRQVSQLAAESCRTGRPAAARVTLQLPGNAWREDRSFAVSLMPVWLGATRKYVRIALRDDHSSAADAAASAPGADLVLQLKNPLSIIQGYLENLLDGMISDPVLLRQSLLTMRKHTLHIERLLDGLRR